MGYIEPDRRRTDARNLKTQQKKKGAGGEGAGKEIMHDYETEIRLKRKKGDTCEVRLPRFRGSKVDLFGGKSSLLA